MAGAGASAGSRYQKIEYLGEGQFATVFKARDAQTDNIVAVKKIKLGSRAEARDGINRTALREIKLMQELQHENVLTLLDVFGQKSDISLVFDYMITDLEAIIKDPRVILYPAHVKCYILQCLRGLEYLHVNWILHRDLKPNNLLVDDKGILKIGDFGLAKFYGSPTRIYTHQVVTRWYRAPELLFGARIYGTGVDMWAIGCILAELLLRVPFLAGETDLDQLSKIFQCMGTPSDKTWPGVTQLPDYVEFKSFPPTPFEAIFTAAGDDLLDLLHKLLAMDPLRRCSSTEALKMPYFSNKPHPSEPIDLPLPSKHKKEQESKRKAEQSAEQDSSVPRKIRF